MLHLRRACQHGVRWTGQEDCYHLHNQLDGVRQADVILVLLLQDVLRGLLVGADGGRLPAAVIAAGIALIQLIPVPTTGLRKSRAEKCPGIMIGCEGRQYLLFGTLTQPRVSPIST